MDIKLDVFFEIALSKIEYLLTERGFEILEFINKDKDGDKDFIFNYYSCELEFDRREKVSLHVNFENYKNDLDFSNISLYGYITSSGGDIFEETAEIIKADYLEMIASIEKNKILLSLENINTNYKNKNRI